MNQNKIEFDAIFHAFQFTSGAEACLASIKQFHPSTDIYVCIDGNGDHKSFVKHAEKYNIKKVIKHNTNILPKARFNEQTSPKKYCERIQELISLCNKEWIILLEDDVRIVKEITQLPETDAAGPNGHPLSESLIFNIEYYTQQKMQNKNYGFCGGTIFRKNIFDGLKRDKLNFDRLIELDWRIGVAGDINLTTLAYLNKKTYSHWTEYGELNSPAEHNNNCAILHNVK